MKSHNARSGDSKDAVLISEVTSFAQNSRDEVRQIGGNIAGALSGQPGMKQQTYIAIPEVCGTLSDGAHMGGGLTAKTTTPD